MPQLFANVVSTPEPVRAIGGANATTVQVYAPLTIEWVTGSPDTVPMGSAVAALEDGTTVEDTSLQVWLVVGVQGTNLLHLAKEVDFANLDTLTSSGQWAPLYRLQVGRLDCYQQS